MSSFRISRERSLYQSLDLKNIRQHQTTQARLSEQMASGKRINRPSDDPSSFLRAQAMTQMTARHETYLNSVAEARGWVAQTESTLDHMVEILTQATVEANRAVGDSRWTGDRPAIAARLESLRDELVDAMNTQHNGEYIFGGNRTAAAPFEWPLPDPAPSPAPDLSGARIRDIGPTTSLQVNIPGSELATLDDGTSIIEAMQILIDGVRQSDSDEMRNGFGLVENALDHVARLTTIAGSTSRRLTLAESNLRDAAILTEARRSELEDTDTLDTILQLQRSETGLAAALQVTARTLQSSILDYLR